MKKTVKEVVIVVRSTPLNTIRFAEALRIAVGQTLCDNRVTVLLMDWGAWNAQEIHPAEVGRPDIKESLALLGPCKIHLFVDQQSLAAIPVRTVDKHVALLSRVEALERIAQADVVMNF